MSFRIRRGTEAQRAASPAFDLGEPVWTIDKQKLYIGDGVTPGGVPLIRLGTGLAWADVNGIPYITATGGGGGGGGGGITAIVQDTNPQLGGNLSLNSNNIGGTGNISITGSLSTTGTANLAGGLGGNLNLNNYAVNGTGSINITGAITATTIRANTGLGANLPLNGFNITGTGNINTTGYITASGIVTGGNFSTSGTISATQGLGANLPLNGYNINGTGYIAMTGGVSINLTTDLQLRRVVDGINSYGYITTTLSRGTLVSPTAVQAGDELGGIAIRGNTNSSTSGVAGIISFVVDPTAVIAGGNYIKSQIVLSAATDSGQDPANALILTSNGVVTSNAFVASKYTQLAVYANDAARTTAIPTPAKGMMVLMSAGTSPAVTNKVVAYDGSNWVALH